VCSERPLTGDNETWITSFLKDQSPATTAGAHEDRMDLPPLKVGWLIRTAEGEFSARLTDMEAKMRRVGLMAALALALVATAQCAPVRADPFDSYNPDLVGGCVAGAGAAEEALRRCIGAGATPCIAADGGATSSHVLCWSHEGDTWRGFMNGAISELNMRAYRDAQRLATANAAWEAWAEAECDYWAWEEGGGSGEQVDRVRCQARVTAERAITLIAAATP